MRRKKDNRRRLRPGNGSSSRNSLKDRFKSNKKFKSNNNRYKSNYNRFKSNNRNTPPHMRQKNKGKRNGKVVLFMIIALVAFIIGAGVGISLSFDDGAVDGNNTTKIVNVTDEMTTNLNETDKVVYNESDNVDYNENQSNVVNNNTVRPR